MKLILSFLCLLIHSHISAQDEQTLDKTHFFDAQLDKWCFTENKGQFHAKTKYYAELPGATITFQSSSIQFLLEEKGRNGEATAFTMQLADANPFAQLIAEEKIPGRNNFYRPGQVTNAEDVSRNKMLTYKNIYPGIDLRFKTVKNKGIKYEFIVNPGADPDLIKIKWNGTENISGQTDGSIKYAIGNVHITDSKPVSYNDGKEISSSFIIKEDITSFEIADYNSRQELIIDPTLQWSTYYGGNNKTYQERIIEALPDKFGNIYAMLNTDVYDSTLVTPTFDSIRWNGQLLVSNIVKFDSTGKRLWATFLPQCIDFSVDDSGNVFLTSYIDNGYHPAYKWGNLVTAGTHQNTIYGGVDIIVIKLDSAGYLSWGTYYGGDAGEEPNSIYVKDSFVYIGGITGSTNKIATIGSYGSLSDAFIAKLNANTGKRVFGRYIYGLEGEENVSDISVDDDGNIYVCGSTTAKSIISTIGSFQPKPFSKGSTDADGYLIKYDKDGNKKWGTYYGRSTHMDIIKNVAVDKNGSVFIFFSSAKNYTGQEKDIDSSFIARFDSTGKMLWVKKVEDSLPLVQQSPLFYWSYKNSYSFNWMHLDANGNIAIGGHIRTVKGIPYFSIKPTPDALKKKVQKHEGYLLLYNSNGEKKYASYFGGADHDMLRFAAGDQWGGYYLAGSTFSTNLHTKNAYDTVSQNNSYTEVGFLARVKFNLTKEAGLRNVKAGDIKTVCENTPSQLKLWITNKGTRRVDSLKFNWTIDGIVQKAIDWKGFVPSGDSLIFSFYAPLLKAGKYNVKIWMSSGLPKDDTVTFSFTINPLPVAQADKGSHICLGEKMVIGSAENKAYRYKWSSTSGFIDSIAQPTISPMETTTYYLTVTEPKTGCINYDSVTITVNPLPLKRAGKDRSICAGEITQLGDSAIANYKYLWFTQDTTIDSVAQPILQPQQTTQYYLEITDTTGCTMLDTVEVTVNPMPVLQSIKGAESLCQRGAGWYGYKRSNDESVVWKIQDQIYNAKPDADSIFIKWDSAGKYTIKVIVSTNSGCSDSINFDVEVFPRSTSSFTVSHTNACMNTPVTFTNTSKNSAGILWKFPDGTTDTAQIITKAFSSPGIYAIWLHSVSSNNCMDSVKHEITIYDMPGREWEIVNTKPGEFNFKALDSLQSYYSWHFGTGDSSNTASTKYIYTTNGKYLVSLNIKTQNGCEIQRDTTINISDIIDTSNISVKENINILHQLEIYPNPFKDKTIIRYNLQKLSKVSLSIYDINGRERLLMNSVNLIAGPQRFILDAAENNISSGIYLLKLEIDGLPAYSRIVKIE